MSNDDFSVFFEVLKVLHEKGIRSIPKRQPKKEVYSILTNNTHQNIVTEIKDHFESHDYKIGPPNPKFSFVLAPHPKGSISACALLPFILKKQRPLIVQIDLVLAKGASDPCVYRFDYCHPRPEHDYFHMQLSESLTPNRLQLGVKAFFSGVADPVPAIPVPAKDSIELLVAAVLAVYGRTKFNSAIDGLDEGPKERIRKARIAVIRGCGSLS